MGAKETLSNNKLFVLIIATLITALIAGGKWMWGHLEWIDGTDEHFEVVENTDEIQTQKLGEHHEILEGLRSTMDQTAKTVQRIYQVQTQHDGRADRGAFTDGIHGNRRGKAEQIVKIGSSVRITNMETGVTVIAEVTGDWPSSDTGHLIRVGAVVANQLGFPDGVTSITVRVKPEEGE
jgi:hypothetical protein